MTVADDLRDTLEYCQYMLSFIEAHPIYLARVKVIEQIVQDACIQSPKYWQAALERAEQMVDREKAR